MGLRRNLWGALVVVLFAAACIVLGIRQLRSAPGVGQPVVERFLDAWERSRIETYIVEQQYTRSSLITKAELTGPTKIAQRPPVRLEVGYDGSVERRDDKRILQCVPGGGSRTNCAEVAAKRSFLADVRRDLEILRSYVEGPGRLYAITGNGGTDECFSLRRLRVQPLSPYGEEATFCFDDDTGAPMSIEIREGQVVDRTITLQIIEVVTDNDLRPTST